MFTKNIQKNHEKILDLAIAKLSKAIDAGDAKAVKQAQLDVVVSAASIDQWDAALKGLKD